jgi:hypothetical protein
VCPSGTMRKNRAKADQNRRGLVVYEWLCWQGIARRSPFAMR